MLDVFNTFATTTTVSARPLLPEVLLYFFLPTFLYSTNYYSQGLRMQGENRNRDDTRRRGGDDKEVTRNNESHRYDFFFFIFLNLNLLMFNYK